MSMIPVPTKVPPVALFHCDICQRTTPLHEPHKCEGLTDRQKRRLTAQKRLDAARRVQANRPTRCLDCAQEVWPATAHACPGKITDPAMTKAQAELMGGLIGTLKRAGVRFRDD